jgi:hypothetical protein
MKKNQRINKERKSIAIIGEGLTEYRYIDAMRTTERFRFRLYPGVPKHSDIDDMVFLAQRRIQEGYDYVLCMIDMDVILSNNDKTEHYRIQKKNNPKITFVESNACTEYWFLLHFMTSPSSREYADYEATVKELKKHIPDYDKSEDFFNKVNIYKYLKENGDLERAINISRELDELRAKEPDVYMSYSQMYKLFDIIDKIIWH